MKLDTIIEALIVAAVVGFAVLVLFSVCGCGGEVESPTPPTVEVPAPTNDEPDTGPYCGDYVCDEQEGETYWNCFDCVNPFTGGPKNGYCGDGICYGETMTSCWKDCRPRAYNPDPEFGPGPGPLPPIGDPIPGPKPGPLPPEPGPYGPPERLPKSF